MRKTFLFTIMLMAVAQLWAAGISQSVALERAQAFLNSEAVAAKRIAVPTNSRELQLAWKCVTATSATAFYVFNAQDAFVIVAGDDRCREILAFGDRPIDKNNLPENMEYWLSFYEKQLEFLFSHSEIDLPPFKAGNGTSVNPLITANWSQNTPYWNECPAYGNDTCYTGCPATSLAMVFHYWKYPQQQTPEVPSYMMPSYATVLPALPPTIFDWGNMIDNYAGVNYTPEQAAAVAHLMRYIGQVEEMDYTISGSGAYGKDVLRAVKFFEYDQNAQLLFKSDDLGYANYSDSQWATMIQNELTNGRPIVYMAYDNYTGAGHAFNVDGYDATADTYHINWGWNGRGNGFFALNAFTYQDYTFGTGQQMVIGIQPPEGYQNPRLQAYPNSLDIQSYINETATATFNLKGTNLTAGVTLTLEDAAGVFAVDVTHLTAADANAGRDIVVTFAPTVVGDYNATLTIASEGADPVTVTINGAAPLEVYDPVMTPVNPSRVTLTSFRADWADATPARNVASYTLEVESKPAYTLLEEADFSDLPKMAPANQASHASDYLPEGWTFSGSEFNLDGGCISMRRNGTITTDVLNLRGYDKMTIEITAKAYGYYGDGSELYVTSSAGTQELIFMYSYETKTIVVDCAENEQIVFKAGYYPMIKDIKIYAGDATQSKLATETGGADYRLIEGITPNKYYTVSGLTAGGTFLYKVKTLYIDGNESQWSNIEMVTLADGGHSYEPGDVNHDGSVGIVDVTLLIDYILTRDSTGLCEICADVNGDGSVDIVDVTDIIDLMLLGY